MLSLLAALALYSSQGARVWVSFVSDRAGNEEVFGLFVEGDKINQRRLTNHPGRDIEPTVGPFGKRIAWASNRSGNWDIWTANWDGSEPKNLTDTADLDERAPSWSSQGGFIFCLSDGRPHLVDAATGVLKEVVAKQLTIEGRVSISPSGSEAVYRDPRKPGLQVLDMDGTSRSILPTLGEEATPLQVACNPYFAAEGRRIVFDSGGQKPLIYIYDLDTEETLRMKFDGYGSNAIIGPFGEGVIFVAAGVSGGTDIFYVPSDAILGTGGGQPRNLTASPGNDRDLGGWANPAPDRQ